MSKKKSKKATEATPQPVVETPVEAKGIAPETPSDVKVEAEYTPECEGAMLGAVDLADPVCQNCQAEPHPDFAFCNAQKEAKGKEGKPAKPKVAGAKKGKVSVAKEFAKTKIAEGKFTRKQIMTDFLLTYPGFSETTIGTILSDCKNVNYFQNKKYGYNFPKLVVQDPATKILHYVGEAVKTAEIPAVVAEQPQA